MAHFPQTHRSVRAPRVRVPNSESVYFSLEGKRIPGILHELSTTGGLAQFTSALPEGALAELHVKSKFGPISALVELLQNASRPAGKMQPFRFVALDDDDQGRLASVIKHMQEQGYGLA